MLIYTRYTVLFWIVCTVPHHALDLLEDNNGNNKNTDSNKAFWECYPIVMRYISARERGDRNTDHALVFIASRTRESKTQAYRMEARGALVPFWRWSPRYRWTVRLNRLADCFLRPESSTAESILLIFVLISFRWKRSKVIRRPLGSYPYKQINKWEQINSYQTHDRMNKQNSHACWAGVVAGRKGGRNGT